MFRGQLWSICPIGWQNLYFCQIATFSLLTQKLFTDLHKTCRRISLSEVDKMIPGVWKLFWRHFAQINAKTNQNMLKISRVFNYNFKTILWIFTISIVFMFSKSKNPLRMFLLSHNVCVISKIQVNFRFERYWWFCLVNFWNFHTIHVFEVREPIADISTELPCVGDLENPGRLPVQHVLGGTGDCVLSIFEISLLFMFLR